MLITVMSERELHVPRLGRVAAADGLPAGRGDEPVRRDRHGADQQRGLRPGLPAVGRLPGRRRRGRDRASRAAAAIRSTDDPTWLAKVGRGRAPHAQPPRRAHRLVGARRDRRRRRRRARWRVSAASPPTDRGVGLDAALVALSGRLRLREGCSRTRRGHRHRAVARRCSAAADDGDGDGRREKRQPRRGRAAADATAAASRRATTPTPRSPTARRRTTSRRELAAQPALRADLARGRRARRGGGRGRLRRRPRRDAGAARRSRRRHRSGSCASWPSGWRRSCSSTSPGAARRGREASARCASCRTGPTAATSTSTPAWRRSSRAAPAGAIDADRLRVRGWVQPATALCLLVDRSGSMGGKPLATAALAAAAVASRAPADYSVLAFGKDVVVAKSQDSTEARATASSPTC